MKKLILAAALVFSVPAFAADVSPEYEKLPQNNRGVLWEQLVSGDTTVQAVWNGGCGLMEATGTQATADFELQWGSQSGSVQDIDSDEAPDGIRFTSVSGLGMSVFSLPAGYVDIKFTSAGSVTQDLDIRLIPLPECP